MNLDILAPMQRCCYLHLLFFFFYCSGDHRDLHSFPTRRSSDLSVAFRNLAFFRTGIIRSSSLCVRVMVTPRGDRKSTRLNSSHTVISYAVFCLKKKTRFSVLLQA